MFQQKVDELRAALEESLSRQDQGGIRESQGTPAEKESEIGQLLVTKKYPAPLVVIDGEPKFAGSIQVKKIVKEVGDLLG